MPADTPIARFLHAQMSRADLDDRQLAAQLDFRSASKTMRRLDELRRGRGDLVDLNERVARALDVPLSALEAAIVQTHEEARARWRRERAAAAEAADAHYRETFEPHGVWLTERTRPSPVFVAALAGTFRLLGVPFPADLPEADRRSFMLANTPDTVPAFGEVTGFAINHSLARAQFYSRHGELLETRARPHRVGTAWMGLKAT